MSSLPALLSAMPNNLEFIRVFSEPWFCLLSNLPGESQRFVVISLGTQEVLLGDPTSVQPI